MRRFLFFSVIVLVLCAASVSAFDGNRKGFVLGGGLGFAPYVHSSASVSVFDGFSVSGDVDKSGVAIKLYLGYAWDEYNMLVYEGNYAGVDEDNNSYIQGIDCAAWYHYFGEKGKTFYTILGLGLYSADSDNSDRTDPGIGYMVGLGYEFARHWQVDMQLTGGKSEDDYFDYGHTNLTLMVSGVAF